MGINFQDAFLKEMKSPSKELSQFLAQRINIFRLYLYDAINILDKTAIPMDTMETEYMDIRNRFLSLFENNAFELILDDIKELYPIAITDYYRNILNQTACVLREKPSLKPN